jgi:hypothetical protein
VVVDVIRPADEKISKRRAPVFQIPAGPAKSGGRPGREGAHPGYRIAAIDFIALA